MSPRLGDMSLASTLDGQVSSKLENVIISWVPEQPDNALAPLPPAVELETRAVLKACIPASAALAAMNQAAALVPNPAILVLFMLQGVEETAQWTTAKILAIKQLADHTAEHVRDRLPKLYSRELVDVIFEQPYCRIANLVDRGIAQRRTASRYLHALAELGVLEEVRWARKNSLFIRACCGCWGTRHTNTNDTNSASAWIDAGPQDGGLPVALFSTNEMA